MYKLGGKWGVNGLLYVHLRQVTYKSVTANKMISGSPWLWGSRKSAANMTALRLFGQQILKGKRAKGQSNPSPQYIQSQAVASYAWSVFRPVADAIRRGITSKLPKQPAASAWYGDNYSAIVGGAMAPAITPDPDLFIFSKGTMTPTSVSAASVISAGADTITLAWPATPVDVTQLASDLVNVVLFNKTTGLSAVIDATVARSAGALTPGIPPGFATLGDIVDVYFAFYGAPSTMTSGTSSNQTLQTVTVVA